MLSPFYIFNVKLELFLRKNKRTIINLVLLVKFKKGNFFKFFIVLKYLV